MSSNQKQFDKHKERIANKLVQEMFQLMDSADGSENLRYKNTRLFQEAIKIRGPAFAAMGAIVSNKAFDILKDVNSFKEVKSAFPRAANIIDGVPEYQDLAIAMREIVTNPDSLTKSMWIDLCHKYANMFSKQATSLSEFSITAIHEEEQQTANNSLLSEAAGDGKIEEVRRLLSLGANVNAELDFTALHKAVTGGHTDVVQLLIVNGADVNIRGYRKTSPLHLAAVFNQQEITKLLLTNGADINAPAEDGTTPLHGAASAGNFEMVKLLISKGANVNSTNSIGSTPLHFSALYGHKKIAEYLIESGADKNMKSKDGSTPLDIAEEKNMHEVADFLRKGESKK